MVAKPLKNAQAIASQTSRSAKIFKNLTGRKTKMDSQAKIYHKALTERRDLTDNPYKLGRVDAKARKNVKIIVNQIQRNVKISKASKYNRK